MIMTYSKHGRSKQDCNNLIEHLLNPENESIEILAIGNSMATDLPGVIQDMEILRDGCGALAAFHHMSISPSIDYTREQLMHAAQALCEEFDGVGGTRPWILIAHTKPRVSGVGNLHGHLVLGHSDGKKCLKDRLSLIRTEVVARAVEHANHENPVKSRHAKVVDKLLRQRGKENVADWLITTFGNDQEPPKSSYGSKSRQAAKRKGAQLPKAKCAVCDAFVNAGNLLEFKTRLAALGFQIERGTKKNVWMIVDGSGNSIGALDRLLKLKRHVASAMMEGQDGFQDAKQSTANDRRTREASPRGDHTPARAGREIKGGPSAAGRADGEGSRRGNHKPIAEPRDPRRAPDVGITEHQRENGRRHRGVGYRRALITLRRIGNGIQNFNAAPLPQLPIDWDAKDIWGIPIAPPKYPYP